MALKKDQIERELSKLREEIKEVSGRGERIPEDSSTSVIIKYLIEERERTNRTLASLADRVSKLAERINEFQEVESREPVQQMPLTEVPVSALEGRILGFVRDRGMICAEDLRSHMNYKGKNAACARLNKLCREGWLQKFQLGHKVYYKMDDAGKATNALIISPPQ